MSLDGLVNEQGPLAQTFARLDPSTIQHSSEICIDRIDDPNLRDKGFWTADGAVYTLEKGEVILYLTDRESNPILKNIKEATDQLIQNHNYIPKHGDLEAAINSANTLRIKLSELRLKRLDYESYYLEIDTKKYNQLNKTERAFTERFFGGKERSEEYIRMLSDEGKIKTTRINVLDPDYTNAPVARACKLDVFGYNSRLFAVGWVVVSSDGWLRGVHLNKTDEGKAQKVEDVKTELERYTKEAL